MVLKQEWTMPALQSTKLTLSCVEIDSTSPSNTNRDHTHDECEIYVNISGDVSFMVENHVYPIRPGSVIITRADEYHHCIYRSNARHKHLWILFSAKGNAFLYDLFFKRRKGTQNRIQLSADQLERIWTVSQQLLREDLSPIEQIHWFSALILTLQEGSIPQTESILHQFPDVESAVNTINACHREELAIGDLARSAGVSINTLERHFQEVLKMSPCEYLKRCRMNTAATLLKSGKSVSETAILSGFCDYSHFIRTFKRSFGITPLQYRKDRLLSEK